MPANGSSTPPSPYTSRLRRSSADAPAAHNARMMDFDSRRPKLDVPFAVLVTGSLGLAVGIATVAASALAYYATRDFSFFTTEGVGLVVGAQEVRAVVAAQTDFTEGTGQTNRGHTVPESRRSGSHDTGRGIGATRAVSCIHARIGAETVLNLELGLQTAAEVFRASHAEAR